jgi:hypothetical protein
VTCLSNDSVVGLFHRLMLDFRFGQYIVNCMGRGRKLSWPTFKHHKRIRPEDKGKAIPLQAWRGLEGSRRLDSQISRQSAHEGGKVVSPTH